MAGKTISEPLEGRAKKLEFDDKYMDVYLVDGRMLRIPLQWYPRLERATMKQRKHYSFSFRGEGIHWPDVDEDISVAGLLRGNKAPRTKAYLTGKWPESFETERKRIEGLYSTKKPIPSKRTKRVVKRAK
jgi:hypothetical protein